MTSLAMTALVAAGCAVFGLADGVVLAIVAYWVCASDATSSTRR